MKRFILLFTVICGVLLSLNTFAKDSKDIKVEVLRKSMPDDFNGAFPGTSYPLPFTRTGDPIVNPKAQAAISTGYYFAHSGDIAGKPWMPDYNFVDTTEDALNWRRILSGPNQREISWFEDPARKNDGYRFFRNDDIPSDSVDDVYAGPIPIGFEFEYMGLRYDSFYVFSNGAIMLSNGRYKYNNANPPVRFVSSNNYGVDNCYNTNSYDWFIIGGRSGDGTGDTQEDDFGQVLATQLSTAAFATAVPSAINVSTRNLPLIAPFWGDGYLSQWDGKNDVPRDRGKVYFYKDPSGNKLIVFFSELQYKGSLRAHPGVNYTLDPNSTSDANNPNAMTAADNGFLSVSGQIILDRTDNSITFNYDRIDGVYIYAGYYVTAGKELLRFNTHSGVFGIGRHQNFDSKELADDPGYTGTIPWAADYNQYTYVWSKYYTSQHTLYPEPTTAVKFKAWKNTLRVVDLGFRVRKQEQGATEFTEKVLTSQAPDFEILAGHEQVGQLQPVAIVQNLSNDIQGPSGVNYQPQDLNFRVRCAIINQATRRPLYNKYLKVDSTSLARKAGDEAFEKVILSKVKLSGSNYDADTMHADFYDGSNQLKPGLNGVPPYQFAQLYLPPFEPNDLYMSNIGLMKAYVMCDPVDPRTGEGFGDMWPFDDTLNIRFWVMRHIPNAEQFIDDVTEFHFVPDNQGAPVPIPSVFKWVSVGAEVSSGDLVSKHPLPPRGRFLCENDEVYPGSDMSSPVIKLKRPPFVTIGNWGGDEIRSFPIDMLTKQGAVLTLAIQRSTYLSDWERGWCDGQLIGCEQRVVNSSWYAVYHPNYGSSSTNELCDQIHVEYSRPSPNWRDGTFITNIATDNWRWHLRRGGAPTEKKMAAYTLFGGGGYMLGFLESDKDSALAPPLYTGQRSYNGLRHDFYDDGIDFEYKKLYVPIPDTFINAPVDGAMYFRFRVRAYARNNQLTSQTIADDEDPFYVDNVRILYSQSGEVVDIEMTKIEIDWPYTMTPASQATAIPIRISLSNNTSVQAPSFWVKASIVTEADFGGADGRLSFFLKDKWVWRGSPDDDNYEEMMEQFRYYDQKARDSARWDLMRKKAIYCRVKQMPFLRPGSDEPITMPNWNARLSPPGKYIVIGDVYVPGGDLEPLNDTTYSNFEIIFGPMFAYHPIPNASNYRIANNDVMAETQEYGRGLTLRGYKMGGTSFANWMSGYPAWEVGDPGGVGGSGSIAMKFELTSEDTVFGYGAFYARKSQAPDYIAYRMYTGNNVPSNEVTGSYIQSFRGYDRLRDEMGIWDEFVFETLSQPLVLKKGTYWVAVTQLGEDGIELGASRSRMGMRCTNLYYSIPPTPDKNGQSGVYLNIEKSFRIRDKQSNQLNKNFFAYENGSGSGAWEQFMNTTGNPSYAHLDHTGITPFDGTTATLSRGTWLPLIVPYLGPRTYSTTLPYKECDIPVELTYFKGSVRQGAIDLVWETASELNNHGFYIERRVVGEENNEWNTMPEFVNGNLTSNIPHEYNFVDTKVTPNTTYQYKLRQVDLDGTQSCDDFSNIVTLTYTEKGSIVLKPNQPNPFNESTTLEFTIPENANVSLEILDVYGNVINTLTNESLSAGFYTKIWNSNDSFGNKVATGTYIYRLSVGDKVLTGKMSLVK